MCYSFNRVRLFVTPQTMARQASLFMEFSRQEYWSGLPFTSPEGLPYPGIEPWSPALWANSLLSEPMGKSQIDVYMSINSWALSFLSSYLNILAIVSSSSDPFKM